MADYQDFITGRIPENTLEKISDRIHFADGEKVILFIDHGLLRKDGMALFSPTGG